MSPQTPPGLFDLLPALYRLRDAGVAKANNLAQGPLQSLLMLIDEQLAVLAADMDQLYDNQFIETCAPWVIPYIGDLIGYRSVNGVAPAVASPRAEVANTISFRRRKGTVLVLEQLARDVTGWGAHAVEFFQVLADTQYMNHIRPKNHYAPNLRGWKPRIYMNSGFDTTAHTVDVRRIASERGRYNIQNIGIFLWSLNAYSLTMAQAAPVPGNPQCYRFNPLETDMPLFNNPVSQGADITAVAGPVNVPDRLLREVLCRDIKKSSPVYYGRGKSVALFIDSAFIDAPRIRVCDLAGADGAWANLNSVGGKFPYAAAIDPELGRIVIPPPAVGVVPKIEADFYYGFNADMGGGEYPRAETFTGSPKQVVLRVPHDYKTIQAALNALGGDGVVEVTDSATYDASGGLDIAVNANGHIELRAADGFRPTLWIGAEIKVTGGADSAFDLNGFVIASGPPGTGVVTPKALIHVPDGGSNQLGHLGLTHCTLVPGSPALLAELSGLQIVGQRSILGELLVNGQAAATLTDCIVDAADATGVAYVASVDAGTHRPVAGGALTLQGCTVIGKVYASLLNLVSDSLFWAGLSAADQTGTPPRWAAPLWSARKQEGCVRYSYLPPGAITPRQFECVIQEPNVPQPLFYSLNYGDPAYAKYSPSTDDSIRRGADDGGEMGVFHFVLAPLRETDLRVRMQEYLPVGLEFGIFYES